MKKHIIGMLFLALLFSSCEEQEFGIADQFVRFGSTSSSILESAAGDSIPIYFSVPASQRSGAVTIDFTTSGTAVEGTDYTLTGGNTVTIADGEYVTYIKYTVIDNPDADGARGLTFTLTNNSAGVKFGFPGPDGNGGSHTLTINDDDCPFDISVFEGTYDVNEDNGAYFYTSEVSITGANTIEVTNVWGSGLTVTVTLDGSDLSDLKAYVLPQNTGVDLCCGDTWITSRPDPNQTRPELANGLPDGSLTTCDGGFQFDFYAYIGSGGMFNSAQSINARYTKQ